MSDCRALYPNKGVMLVYREALYTRIKLVDWENQERVKGPQLSIRISEH